VIGCIAPVRDFFSPAASGPLRFVGSFTRNLGSAGIPLSTVLLGASLCMPT
jgi:predicted permease